MRRACFNHDNTDFVRNMLLTITTTHRPATDIGYLLGKNPNRSQSFSLAFGQGHVFYPVATEERCTVSLLLDIDPVALVRGRRGSSADSGLLGQYVNDRPYVASSFLSVAIASVYGSAMKGYTKEPQELANTKIPLTTELPAVQCRGGESFLRRLFEPLYTLCNANSFHWIFASRNGARVRTICTVTDPGLPIHRCCVQS